MSNVPKPKNIKYTRGIVNGTNFQNLVSESSNSKKTSAW